MRCPAHDDLRPSLKVSDCDRKTDGIDVHCFAGCDWRDVKAKLVTLGLLNKVPARTLKGPARARPMRSRGMFARAPALTLWAESRHPTGTPVLAYLESRGLHLPLAVLDADAIRFHPHCPFKLDDGTAIRLPTMVALMRDVHTNEARAIHRTALLPDGTGKAQMPDGSSPKKMLGPVTGSAVKLIVDQDVTLGLGLAEGIETALTPICVGWSPVWACGSAGAIKAFPVLPGIEHVTIFADADESGRGLQSARVCARCWQHAGCSCDIILPPKDGMDWNDARGPA
jgi:hypothetical protein